MSKMLLFRVASQKQQGTRRFGLGCCCPWVGDDSQTTSVLFQFNLKKKVEYVCKCSS